MFAHETARGTVVLHLIIKTQIYMYLNMYTIYYLIYCLAHFSSVLRPFQDYFSSPISRWGENVSTLRKNTWHSRKLNLACIICGQCGARIIQDTAVR